MELRLQRTYHAKGTNGVLTIDDEFICYTIELPWRENRRGLSCIPEGRYSLEARYSPLLKNHLQVEKVPGRTLILIHPANDALRQLKGCIAPVSEITGIGKGSESRLAFIQVKELAYDAIWSGDRVWLTIYSQQKSLHEKSKTGPGDNKTTGAGYALHQGAPYGPHAKVL